MDVSINMILVEYLNKNNMNKILCAILCVVIYMNISCSNEERKISEIKQMVGRKIDFGNNYRVLPDSLAPLVQKSIDNDTIVVTYLDEVSCTDCTVKMLRKWHEVINQISPSLQLLVVIRTENIDEIRELVLRNGLGPVLIYENNSFVEKNNLRVLARNRTFLLDSGKTIILVGEPYGNKKMINLYKRVVDGGT